LALTLIKIFKFRCALDAIIFQQLVSEPWLFVHDYAMYIDL